jgi:glutamine synthetase
MRTDNLTSEIVESLKQKGVSLIACTFVDNAGVTRVKIIPLRKLESATRTGVGISTLFTVFAIDDHITSSPGFEGPSGDMRLIPDSQALTPLASAPGWAWAPVDQYDQEGQVLPVCQRSLLKRLVDDAAARGITFKMAFEPEFTLLDGDGEPAHSGPGYSPWALIPAEEFIRNLVEALEEQGIYPEQIHPEYAMGQYEMSIVPLAPLQAADLYILLRLTIRRLARKFGYYVSFAPVVIRGQVGNGCHLHFSAWKDGKNLMAGGTGPEGLTQEGEALAAGVLDHLYELTAVVAPSVPSYERLKPGNWAGAFTCWGWENREAALRLVKGMLGSRDKAANFELKSIDGTSNPYLVLAMVIASAIDGLKRGLRLPAPFQVDPATLTDETRTLHGVRQLPTNLADAIDELGRSTIARETLGRDLFEAFVAVRRLEWETFGEQDIDQVVEFHRWRYG